MSERRKRTAKQMCPHFNNSAAVKWLCIKRSLVLLTAVMMMLSCGQSARAQSNSSDPLISGQRTPSRLGTVCRAVMFPAAHPIRTFQICTYPVRHPLKTGQWMERSGFNGLTGGIGNLAQIGVPALLGVYSK